MFFVLMLLFFTVPLVEIYVLLEVGGVIGALPTIGLVVLTAVIGAGLIRAQGITTLRRVQQQLEQQQSELARRVEERTAELQAANEELDRKSVV